ncbi:hypothetical protein QQS45_08470 [Alteriqipengyuania flavescens]|uniref:hypothetical protein n=1 Tax=Alteriqipengyuania flavescens TaxID=3053610 RepID=UPI0025B473A2|nr:hypothetical protein [Alteriqipengyuania flavescens]WJY17681.1 hypothetical protein QQW98_08465 [Alteriqipengyuania flavescens]WJY23624.1 hypothetical protein QQS45_08470 [Alteriqipengyuania flavescens]
MSRANDDLMDAIHGLVAGGLKDELERAMHRAAQPRQVKNEQGDLVDNPDYAPLNPQLIDKARAFLKDNGVDAPAKAERVDTLAGTLADLDLDEEAMDLRR